MRIGRLTCATSLGMAVRKISVGMLGCGVVGQGILRLLETNRAAIEARLGGAIEVSRILVRDTAKVAAAGVDPALLTTDPADVLERADVDVIVEVMGGIEPAGSYLRRAIDRGLSVVTANKALLAERGDELIEAAEAQEVDLYFEAAVAGGIPIIRTLREALASDRVVAMKGIVNGTSNYILSRMNDAGLEFDVALKEAQAAGYAEADPTLDVNGGDAAHKLTILATLAYGARLHASQVPMEGIDTVGAVDMAMADRFGYVIKPLAVARRAEGDALDLRVHPALVEKSRVLASITGALNAVFLEGATLGPCLLSGRGAGADPTATSVVADIIDVGRNLLSGARGRVPTRAFLGERLTEQPVRDIGDLVCRYYLRFVVCDEPGVLARIAGVLGEHRVSIEQMVQTEAQGQVNVVMITHACREADLTAALQQLRTSADLQEPPRRFRIDEG